jgi:hypothetical protein
VALPAIGEDFAMLAFEGFLLHKCNDDVEALKKYARATEIAES